MPIVQLIGNAALSFITKASSGYWNLMDPTNGYIAINFKLLKLLPLEKIDNRYFFESDMLFRLNTIKAVVKEVSINSIYGDEVSNLSIRRSFFEFSYKNILCFFKRIFYDYFLRNFGIFSLELILGIIVCSFGIFNWIYGNMVNTPTTSGTVMIATLPIIIGFQLLLSCLFIDIQNIPKDVLSKFKY